MNIKLGYVPLPNHFAGIMRSEGFQRMADQALRLVESEAEQRMEDAKWRNQMASFTRVR